MDFAAGVRRKAPWIMASMAALTLTATAGEPSGKLPTASAFTPAQRAQSAQARSAWRHPDLTAAQWLQKIAVVAAASIRRAAAVDPNAPVPAAFQGNLTQFGVDSTQAVELQRQADCSLTFGYSNFQLSLTKPDITVLATTPRYQDVLRTAAGVTAAAGAFAHGCAEKTVGIGSRPAFYLGKTSQNLYMAALAAYDAVAGTQALYYGTVDVTTQTVKTYGIDTSMPEVVSLVAGDLDGDGLADIVGLDRVAGRVGVWLAHADGSVSAPQFHATAGSRTTAAVLADFDGDGKLDLLASTADESGAAIQEAIAFLKGHGDGSFDAARTFAITSPSTGAKAPVSALVAVDLRGTGKFDVVGSNGLILLNDGTATFTQAAFAFPSSFAGSSGGVQLASGDFDEDGKQDVVVDTGSVITIYRGRGDATFAVGRSYANNDSIGYVTATDLDGDGHLDLYIGLANGGFFGGDQFGIDKGYALMGRGDGSFSGAPVVPFVFTGRNLVDLDGDGKLDGVGLNDDLSFTSWLGDGTGGFAAHSTLPLATIRIGPDTWTPNGVSSFGMADITGDGKPDLVFTVPDFAARNSSSETTRPGMLVAIGDGQGGFGAPIFLPAPSFVAAPDFDVSEELSNVHLVDVNGDGRIDLLYGYARTSYQTHLRTVGTAVQLGNGDGTFQAPSLIEFAAFADTGSTIDRTADVQLVEDLNGDGKPDLVLVAQTSTRDSEIGGYRSTIQVAIGAGDGSFAAPVAVTGPDIVVRRSLDLSPTSIVAADMNGDGKTDLVMYGASTAYWAQVAIALGNGDGTFKAPGLTTFAAQALGGAQQIAVADFNADGKRDVLFANPFGATGIAFGAGDGTLATLGTVGASILNRTIDLPIGGATRVLELNGDGKPDVLVGDTLLVSSTAAAVVAAPAFTIDESSAAGTVAAGQSAQTTVKVTPDTGFTGTVTFSCSGVPTGAACSFAPASLAVNGSTASSVLTITTTARTTALLDRLDRRLPGGTVVAVFMLLAVKRRRDWKRTARDLGLLAAFAATALAFTACGGGGGDDGSGGAGTTPPPVTTGTPAGSYTIAVTATDATVTRNLNYTLTVN